MFEFFSNNPLVALGLICACWPGLLPVGLAWWIGRRYDLTIKKRPQQYEEGRGEDV